MTVVAQPGPVFAPTPTAQAAPGPGQWQCYCCQQNWEWPLPCLLCTFGVLNNGRWGCACHGKPEKP